jgi:hypothetical protein
VTPARELNITLAPDRNSVFKAVVAGAKIEKISVTVHKLLNDTLSVAPT